jgi:hypothetical protein
VNVTPTVIDQNTSEAHCHSLKPHDLERDWFSRDVPASEPSHHPSPDGPMVRKPVKRRSIERKRLTVSLPVELLERSRNTVYWTKGLTLARLLEQALTSTLDQRERLNGQPFGRRLEDLKGGRPRSSERKSD